MVNTRGNSGVQYSNSGSSDPVAPNSFDIQSFTDVLQQFSRLLQPPPKPPKPDIFSGDVFQEPEQFLKQLKTHLEAATLSPNATINEIAAYLDGEAAIWFQQFDRQVDSFDCFNELFLQRYNSGARFDKLRAILYGEYHQETDRAVPFLLKKKRLCNRLHPDWSDEEIVKLIRRQLHVQYRVRVGPHPINSTKELMLSLIDIDNFVHGDPAEIYANISRKPSSVPRSKQHITDDRTNKEAPPCHHCPQRHWHSDCPVIHARRQRNHVLNYVSSNLSTTAPRIATEVKGRTISALLDTAATHNFAKPSQVQYVTSRTTSSAFLGDESATMEITGTGIAHIQIRGELLKVPVVIAPKLREDLILGLPFLEDQNATLDIQHGCAYIGCSRSNHEGHSRSSKRPVGRYGDYLCDAPWDLIESATKAMVSKQGDNFEFVLWTGDNLSSNSDKREGVQLHVLKNLTDLLMKTFTSQFVFPALGHDDPTLKKEKLGKIWGRWIPTEAMDTLETGGYYMIEIKSNRLRIIVLNTNLMLRSEEDEEATKQWNWLTQMLEKIYKNEKVVYIVGHIPPGSDERQRGTMNHKTLNYDDYHNKKYLELVRRYSTVIAGQFFGHLHSDSFRVIYNKRGRPVSWAMLAPAVTPRQTPDGSNNPGLRLYRFDKTSGQILDYTQYYLDLPTANLNSKSEPEWVVEYNFSSYYGISTIMPLSLHNLADRLTLTNDQSTFTKYFKANSVRMYNSPQGNCDANCAHTHYCAITRVDYEEYEQCLKTAASALASSSTAASENFRRKGGFCIYMLIVIAITTYRVR